MMNDVLQIHPADNVAVALRPLQAGEQIHTGSTDIRLRTDVPAGHKILLTALSAGTQVIKYGYPIGHLREDHQAGDWVDERHIATNLSGVLDYTYQPVFSDAQLAARADSRLPFDTSDLPDTFEGYQRAGGEVGIRNELWIVPTVGCVNGICQQLCERMKAEVGESAEGIQRIVAFPHNYGCSQLSGDHENTRKILRDLVLHPNAGGVLVVGLGCENNQPEAFMELLGDYDHERIRLLVCQQVEGDEIEEGMRLLRQIYAAARHDHRTSVPLSRLRVGLKCGGSDGFSGITANPLLGLFSDFLVGRGGTTVLTEVPEMFGAETILMNRCADRSLFDQTVKMINDFKTYFLSHGEPVGENPSPGNKAGGISTLEDKALGCTQKCGHSAVRGVLAYADRLRVPGLNLLSAPGNDLVASTALSAAGCHLILFTTGRGTPFGSFVPTMKISSNSSLYARKPSWIDFDAGTLVTGTPMAALFHDLAVLILDTASGRLTRNERNGYQEISIFKNGITL